MSKILEMRQKRSDIWDKAKAFLDAHTAENGLMSAEDTLALVVSGRLMITVVLRSRPPPREAVTGEHLVGALGSPRAGPVALRRLVEFRPVVEDGVEDRPPAVGLGWSARPICAKFL